MEGILLNHRKSQITTSFTITDSTTVSDISPWLNSVDDGFTNAYLTTNDGLEWTFIQHIKPDSNDYDEDEVYVFEERYNKKQRANNRGKRLFIKKINGVIQSTFNYYQPPCILAICSTPVYAGTNRFKKGESDALYIVKVEKGDYTEDITVSEDSDYFIIDSPHNYDIKGFSMLHTTNKYYSFKNV